MYVEMFVYPLKVECKVYRGWWDNSNKELLESLATCLEIWTDSELNKGKGWESYLNYGKGLVSELNYGKGWESELNYGEGWECIWKNCDMS